MAGQEPYSHMAAEFPPAVRFVRIQSNFESPGQNPAFDKLARERLAGARRFMVLIPVWQHIAATSALKAFGLTPDWQACQKVTDRLYDDSTLDLCPVTATAFPD